MTIRRVLFQADGVADALGLSASPGAVLLELESERGACPIRLLASGPPDLLRRLPEARDAQTVALEGRVLLPGFVNAHTHLDLSHLGPREFDLAGGFAAWVRAIRDGRRSQGCEIAESVRQGIALSLAGGVVAVGDIAGAMRMEAADALRASGLMGISFLEFFGIGARQEDAMRNLDAALAARPDLLTPANVRLGLQPHAPYSAGLPFYSHACDLARKLGLPLATHLAESPAERRLIEAGEGPLVDMLRHLGVWDAAAAREVGYGHSPVEHLTGVLAQSRWTLAHLNDCSDADLATLRRTGATVVYCPRATAYFGHELSFGPHRYRDMLAAGISVALGTDSVVNIPSAQAHRLSTFDEMRLLYHRDGAEVRTLLAMATIHGAHALGLDPSLFTLGPITGAPTARPIAGLVAVAASGPAISPIERALSATDPSIELLVGAGACTKWYRP